MRKLRFVISLCLGILAVSVAVLCYSEQTDQFFSDLYDDMPYALRRLWRALTGWTRSWLIKDGLWDWGPTHSAILNFGITFVLAACQIVLIVIVFAPILCVYVFLAALYLIFYYSLLAFGYTILRLLFYLVLLLTKLGIWVLNDLFRASIDYVPSMEGKFGDYVGGSLVVGFAGLEIALILHYIAFPLLWFFPVRPILTGYALIFYGRERTKEIKMKYRRKRGAPDEVQIPIPETFDEAQIEADIQLYGSDEHALAVYFTGLAKRFKTKSQMKVIQAKTKQLNLGKEAYEAAYEAKVARHKYERVDEEQELERQKMEIERRKIQKELEKVDLEAEVDKRRLEIELAELDAREKQFKGNKKEKEQKDEVKATVDELVNTMITLKEAEDNLKEIFGDDPERLREAIDELRRQAVQKGVLSEDY